MIFKYGDARQYQSLWGWSGFHHSTFVVTSRDMLWQCDISHLYMCIYIYIYTYKISQIYTVHGPHITVVFPDVFCTFQAANVFSCRIPHNEATILGWFNRTGRIATSAVHHLSTKRRRSKRWLWIQDFTRFVNYDI